MPSEHNVSKEFVALLRAHDLDAWREFEGQLKEHDVSCSLKNCQVLQEFVELLKDYNREAWRVFAEDKRTKNLVKRSIHKVKNSHSQEDVEEISQEAILRAWASQSHASAYRGQAPPRAWFTPIVHNAAIDHFTKAERKREAKFSELSDEQDLIDTLLGSIRGPSPAGKCLVSEVWDAVAGLPPNFRLHIILRFSYGYTDKEIADHLNIPEKTVNSNMRRALDKLRKYFELYKWRGLIVGKLTNQQKHCCVIRGWSGGVVIKGVENSATAEAGIKINHIVVNIGLDPVCDMKEFERTVNRVKASSAVKLTIVCCTERDGELEITILGKASNGKQR